MLNKRKFVPDQNLKISPESGPMEYSEYLKTNNNNIHSKI